MKLALTRKTLVGVTAATSLFAITACGGNVGGGAEASGEEFPTEPITLTVGQEAGGSTDRIARAVAEGASDELGVPMPVVNKPGANGALATKEVAGMPADGQNLVLLNASLATITPLAVGEEEAIDLDNLDIIKGLSQDDYVLVASEESGITNLDELKARSGDVSYGTAGVGTGSQLSQSLLLEQAGIEGTEVPFDSGAPALTAVMGNQVQVATVQLGEAMPQIEAGTVEPLVVFSKERNQYLPEVPTAVESGYEVPVSQYRAIAAPKGLPENVQNELLQAFEETLDSESYQEFNEENLLTPWEVSGEEVRAEWTELADKYEQLVEEYDISLSEN